MGNDPEDACTHLLVEEDLVNGNDMIGCIENLQKTISSRLQFVFGKDEAAGNLSLSGDDDVNDQVEIFDFPCKMVDAMDQASPVLFVARNVNIYKSSEE
ncbi:hypothetical protein DKX38_003936 [Salix brachista]|uniref:Uncharacterized protein n=1 Tax=Salix brachista TaxID=2182728 RepID=A0A5N5N9R9_9ROSI|nr:hypothetical protein DKX38_003936 [Salix brachista]